MSEDKVLEFAKALREYGKRNNDRMGFQSIIALLSITAALGVAGFLGFNLSALNNASTDLVHAQKEIDKLKNEVAGVKKIVDSGTWPKQHVIALAKFRGFDGKLLAQRNIKRIDPVKTASKFYYAFTVIFEEPFPDSNYVVSVTAEGPTPQVDNPYITASIQSAGPERFTVFVFRSAKNEGPQITEPAFVHVAVFR